MSSDEKVWVGLNRDDAEWLAHLWEDAHTKPVILLRDAIRAALAREEEPDGEVMDEEIDRGLCGQVGSGAELIDPQLRAAYRSGAARKGRR